MDTGKFSRYVRTANENNNKESAYALLSWEDCPGTFQSYTYFNTGVEFHFGEIIHYYRAYNHGGFIEISILVNILQMA